MEQINEDDFTGYGEEMIGLVKSVKSQSDEIARLKGETNQLAERQVKSEADVYFDTLDARVPGWRTLNKNQGFLAWLRELDGLSGRTRQENMTAAHNAFDASTVIKYFSSWKGGPMFPPNSQRASVSTPGGSPWQPQVTVTRDQFNKAVQDKIQGRITEDQFEKISNSFQKSLQAGEIVGERVSNT